MSNSGADWLLADKHTLPFPSHFFFSLLPSPPRSFHYFPAPFAMSNNDQDLESLHPLTDKVQNHDEELKELERELGAPVSLPISSPTATSPPKIKLSAATIIPIWIVLSSSVIIYNNYLYNTLGFEYPVFLVTWHLTFAVRLI